MTDLKMDGGKVKKVKKPIAKGKTKDKGGKVKSIATKAAVQNKIVSSYDSTCMFLNGVGEFCKAKLGYKFPTTWGGFNVCMAPIPAMGRTANKYLFVSRIFLTPEMMYGGKIVVGTKPSPVTQAPHMRSQDYSQSFFWGNWSGTELSVMFIGSFDAENGLVIDESYTPFILSGCKSFFQKPPCVYTQAKELGIPGMLLHQMSQLSCSDYRIFTLGNDIIMHDAYTTFLNKMVLNHEQKMIRYERWVSSMCQLPTWLTGKDIEERQAAELLKKQQAKVIKKSGGARTAVITGMDTKKFKNELVTGAPYYKYFDKNWSFIGMQGEQLMFLDWFYPDGVHAVTLDPETGYCIRKRIVEFNKDPIPRDADEMYPDFSLGTTTMSITKGKRIDVIGVGHVKFHWDHVSFEGSRLYKEVAKIDALFNKTFGRNYKRHIKYVYACFFYRIKQHSKNKFDMTMSDLWIPFFEKEKEKYHSLVVFPMGVTKSLDNEQDFHVSAGLSDYYNIVMTFKKEDVLSKLVHDVSNMNMKKLYLDVIRY